MRKKRKEQMTPAMLEAEREGLLERVAFLESEDEIQCKRSHELQVKNAELKQQLDKLQQEYGIAVKAAVTWEVRFDRLLSVVSGQTTDAAKWGAAIENMRTANLGTADRSKRFQLDARTE